MIKELDKRKRIAIVTSGHSPYDDRIFWKFGITLSDNYDICIITSTENINSSFNNISLKGFNDYLNIKDKIDKFLELLKNFNPDLIICEEPVTVFAAIKFKIIKENVKIILDVTEWYPENIAHKQRFLKAIFIYITLYSMNIVISNFVDWIIIGETSKRKRYDLIAPFKPKSIIGYYPVMKYFNYHLPKFSGKSIVLCYAGVITFQRGIINLLSVANILADKRPKIEVQLLIIGKFSYKDEEIEFKRLTDEQNKVKVSFKGWNTYDEFSENLKDADICFDLRERNFIYRNSLPIKIFEYMACGKPFIYSDIIPIRKELGNIECGFLVNPNDLNEVVNRIEDYIDNKSLLINHSKNGRLKIENGKNWENESVKLLNLIEILLK